jgi:hypothetical protein
MLAPAALPHICPQLGGLSRVHAAGLGNQADRHRDRRA